MDGRHSPADVAGLDWTERRPHLAGALGAAVLAEFFEHRWIARVHGSRAVRLTVAGQAAIAHLGDRERATLKVL